MRLFKPTDIPEINSWLRARAANEVSLDGLPDLGYFEPGVAAGFVLVSPMGFAIFGDFVSNPVVESAFRARALLAIADELIEISRLAGAKRWILHSVHPAILKWGLDKGMDRVGTAGMLMGVL